MDRQIVKLIRSLQKRCQQSYLSIAAELHALRNPAQPVGELAAAFALGTLISFIPVPILDTLLVGLVFTRLKRINRAPIFIARVIWNDLLVYPLYGPGYRLGSALVVPIVSGSQSALGGSAVTAVSSLLVAVLILSIIASSAGYLLFYVGLKWLRGTVAG